MLKEDLEEEITNGVKVEEESQMYFAKDTKGLREVLAELRAKQQNIKQGITDANKLLEADLDDKADLDASLNEELEYLNKLKPDCKPIIEEFAFRTAQRDAD